MNVVTACVHRTYMYMSHTQTVIVWCRRTDRLEDKILPMPYLVVMELGVSRVARDLSADMYSVNTKPRCMVHVCHIYSSNLLGMIAVSRDFVI